MRNIEFDVVPGSTAQSGTMEDRLNYFINMREDYAGDCECNLSIDGLVVRFDRTVNWGGNNTFTFDVVRMNAGTAFDYGIDTKDPHTVIGRNIVFDLDGMSAILPDNFAFSFCRPLKNLYTPADRTYLPGLIKVENMTAIHVPDDKNAVMAVFRCGDDMAQNPFGSRVKLSPKWYQRRHHRRGRGQRHQ
ncbi:hypothetical protein [Klebsiella pneumoniae]|uniref:hypothetical protein n=1 Tax=Klebsiella pneumoniae TaxID=573 RepID=UPI003891057E